MPVDIKLPNTPNNEWRDAQYPFDGAWMPAVDPALIGARNFSNIQNLRYNDKSIEGVGGYTFVNATAISDYTLIRNGIQLRTNKTVNTYNLVHALHNSTNQGRVYVNETAIGTQGNFSTNPIDISGNSYFQDAAVNLEGRFSTAPQNSIAYCNGQESLIFSGAEHRLAAVFQAMDISGGGINDVSEDINSTAETSYIKIMANMVADGDMEDDPANNFNQVGTPSAFANESTIVKNGAQSLKFTADAANEGMATDAMTISASTSYRISVWIYPDDDTAATVTVIDDVGSLDDTSHTLNQDAWNLVTLEVTTNVAATTLTITIDSGATVAGDWYIDDLVCVESGYYPELLIMTTRPAQAYTFDVLTANTTASTMAMEYWNGSAFTSISNGTDGTRPGTITLAQDGTYSFDHTNGSAKFRHFEELYLFAYRVTISAGSAEINNITANYGFQPLQNVWDGVYRQPIQFQIWDNSENAYEDYTLQVNQSSDISTPVGALMDQLGASDHFIIMFEEQVAGIRLTMLGNLINSNTETLTFYYWNGFEWATDSSFEDGTLNDDGTITLSRTGLMRWTPPSDEKQQTLFNSVGYAYKFVPSGALSGTDDGTDDELVIDIVSGVPALSDAVKPFEFSALYKNRLMLGSFATGAEGNRMDFSVSNAPDVYNGSQSSQDGLASLYFGGVEPITCATQLYNRFGASVFSMLLVFKDSEVYLLVGDTPYDFTIYPVSQTTGCPAPLTLAVAEVGFDVGQGLSRNVAIWLSNSGPMMFDGAIISPIKGIENFFDPNETEYIEWDSIHLARGWVDQTYKEYNLLLPSTDGQTTNNIWLVYDLVRRKWFKKDTGTEEFPQCGWNVMDPDTGEQTVYAGIDVGKIVELEEGTSWGATYADATAGSGIQQQLRTGDFFPSDNIWDEILIRKFKLICKKIPSSVTTQTHNLAINYYSDTADSGANVIFEDSDASSGVYVDFKDMDVDADGVLETSWTSSASAVLDLSLNVGLDRIVRIIQDMNSTGWAHSFEFEVTTDDVPKGWQPIVWGIRYRIERKDDTSTVTS